ncbi:MAG TPA: hypothetical protein VG488_13775 [Candidatus Angelobacter sp.]|nr:hypothetical protein [Candidatus Angelobacter sp.]
MNRRDLLKQAGAMLLAGPYLDASVFDNRVQPSPKVCPPSEATQDLTITFKGPFCYWKEGDYIQVMAPPVGPSYCFPHIPWIGTTCNEVQIPWQGAPTYELNGLEGLKPRPGALSGEKICDFKQEKCTATKDCNNCVTEESKKYNRAPRKKAAKGEPYTCCSALFSINVPPPDMIVGAFPTCAQFNPPRPDQPYYASGVIFYYKNTPENPVTLNNINLATTGNSPIVIFKPEFGFDKGLPSATLSINLTPKTPMDPNHTHAHNIFKQMCSMFPWIKESITFCGVPSGAPTPKRGARALFFGPGDDCQAPVFLLNP